VSKSQFTGGRPWRPGRHVPRRAVTFHYCENAYCHVRTMRIERKFWSGNPPPADLRAMHCPVCGEPMAASYEGADEVC
jgi:hypothetical protein